MGIKTMNALKTRNLEALQEVARIDARIRAKLLKRARKQGVNSQAELVNLVEMWKRAAARTDRKYHTGPTPS
jgi:hypothetical protein